MPGDHPSSVAPAYASCELLAGKPADRRDDLYALACLACELLSGQHPFWHQRATHARMTQAVPTRPPDLNERQWRTLQRGLAWDREQRSIPVREWLAALNPQPAAIGAIPRPQQLGVAPAPPAKLGARRVMAALGLFLACLCAWAMFNRPAPGRLSMTAAAVAPAAAASTSSAERSDGGGVASDPAVARASAGWNDSAPLGDAVVPSGTGSMSAAGRAAQGAPAAGAGPRTPASPPLEKIDLASTSYTLPPGARFAEIRVRRNRASHDRASFEWWTEASSAQSGVDFVKQPPAKVTFRPGSRTASLFVKVLHDSARKRAAKFDVLIGGASKGTLLGVSRAEVTLTAAR
jgi:hypothetical protein